MPRNNRNQEAKGKRGNDSRSRTAQNRERNEDGTFKTEGNNGGSMNESRNQGGQEGNRNQEK